MPRLPDEVRRALQRLQGGGAPGVPRPGVTARQQINLEELRGRIAGGVEKSFQEAKIREAQEQRAAEFRPSLASGLDRPIQVADPSEQEYGQPPGWLTPITDKVADWVGSGAEQVVDWAEPVTKRLAGPMKDLLESAPFNREAGRMGLDALRTLGVGFQGLGLAGLPIVSPYEAGLIEKSVGGPGQFPFQPPSPKRIPGALKAFAGALTEETEGDALTRTQNAIEAYQDAMKAGWGYWFASEMAAGAIAAPGLAGAGRGVVGVAARPGLMETVQPLTRLVPQAARPTVERAIRPGLRGLGETLQLPLKAETAIGKAMVAPLRPLVDPVRGAVKRLRGRPGEEVLSVPTEDVPGIDEIIDPTTTAAPVTTAEMEAAQAGTMVQGPRTKLEILRERLKQAEDAVSALEARQPYSRKLPTAAPTTAARGPGAGARVVVPDDPSEYGKLATNDRILQPNGETVRGTPISLDDARIPDEVYHVTTNAPAVRSSGMLRASGEGGLGGSKRDQLVSFTIDKEIATQLVDDFKLAIEVTQLGRGEVSTYAFWKTPERVASSRQITTRLLRQMESEGWDSGQFRNLVTDDKYDHIMGDYTAHEWLNQYFSYRSTATAKLGAEKRNPLFFTDIDTLAGINPANVDIIPVPKSSLRTGAMVTDLDLANRVGLKEIRIYGDVSVAPPAPAAPGPAPSRVAGEVDLTRRLQDQIDLNEAEWFAESNILERRGLAESLGLSRPKSRIETFDDQLAAAREAERTARAALTTQETFARGRFAKEATTEYRRDVGLREEPWAPTTPEAQVGPGVAEGAGGVPKVGAPGAGGNTQRLPMNVGSRAEAQANIAREMFEPVEGSRIDEAASAYLRTKHWPDYIEGMGPASKDFPVHPSFAAQPMRNIGAFTRYMTDSTRTLQAMDQGVFGDAAQKYIGWTTRRTDLAGKEFAKTYKTAHRKLQEEYEMVASLGEELTPGIGPLREHGTFNRTQMLRGLAGDVLEEISPNDVIVPVRELLARPNIARWLKKITPEEQVQVVGYAQKARIFLDDLFVKQNQARVARGQDPIPYIEKYRPWIKERNIWSRMGFGKESAQRFGEKAEIPDFITPKAWFNPRAQQRAGGLQNYWKERDLGKLIDDYVETATKDIFNTNIIQNAKPYIKNLRDRKLGGSAKAIEGWIMETYAGVKPPISKYAIKGEAAVGEFLGTSIPIRRGIFAIRKNLARAVFPLNWVWNLTTQSASIANTYMRYGATRTIQGLSYIGDSAVRREVLDNAYGAKVKQWRSGRAAYQEAGRESIAEIERKPIEKVEDFANYFTNKLEENLTGVSTQAARKEAESMGLTGRAMWEYASEGGSKTQSMYNIADVPTLLRAPEVGSVVPFQTFSFNMMNDVLETLPYIVPERLRVGAYAGVRLPSGQIGKTGIAGTTQYKLLGRTVTVQNRLKALARWTAGITVFAIVADNVMGRQPWKLSSFIPFFGLLTNGAGVGNPYNDPLMYKYFADFRKGVQAYTKYGNWEKLRTWVIGYHMLGGTQVNKTIKGIEAVADGRVTDVRGETLFETDPPGRGLWGLIPSEHEGKWDAFKAITQGPYAVTEGRKYKEGLKGGVVEEYLGFNLGTWTESEEDKMRRLTNQYTMTVDGKETTYSDLPKHPSVREAVKRAVPSGLRDSVDEYIDANFSKRKELAMVPDFMDIREALSKQSSKGGKLYRLRGDFADGAPVVWKFAKARLNQSFPGDEIFKTRIREQLEAGKEFPEIDYSDWTFK
jgi:hypothetical protein